MKTNVKPQTAKVFTHEGGRANRTSVQEQLKRTVMSCMLWEDGFYEDGISIAQRIQDLVPQVSPEAVQSMAIEAREEMKLRHVPLLLVREMARLPEHRKLVSATLERVIQRADEISEFVAIYWKEKRQPLSAQVKKGLARAFTKFSAYDLAKYDREGAVRLRDVLFLCHAKPNGTAQHWTRKERAETVARIADYSPQERDWQQLIEGTLPIPDTWETAQSAGGDKKEIWERLIAEKKLGAMAFIRNLRNMQETGVDQKAIRAYFSGLDASRLLPFRMITAARHAPQWEPELEGLLFQSAAAQRKLKGHTVILMDVSGSMKENLSANTEIRKIDAACGIAMVAREMCESAAVYIFNDNIGVVPARRGFALRDLIVPNVHGSTYMGAAVSHVDASEKYDRLIVITDEQSHDTVPSPKGRGYILNIATDKNGVGYGAWTHVHGWSESVLNYIGSSEG